jgi:hypothetical protein
MKGIENLIFKGFNIACKCVESILRGWLWHYIYIYIRA